MSTDERIDAIEKHLKTLHATQADLYQQLKEARVDQWKTRIDDLEAQVNHATTSGNDRLKQADDKLRGAWTRTCAQVDEASSTASTVADTLRDGLHGAYNEVRDALLESRSKISG
jgi:predicted  nucleic acid-binding Zn-ribbon protein